MSVLNQNRRQSPPFSHQINKFISRYPDLKYNGSAIYCLMCRRRLVGWNASDCRQHVSSSRHKRSRKSHMPYWTFVYDFIFMLSVCDIPQNMLDTPQFRVFWQKYFPNWTLPTRKQVCTEFPHVKEVLENQIRCELRGKKLWVTVAIVDVKKDKVVNVLVRILKENYSSKPFLIASRRLKQLDGEAIHNLVKGALMKFCVNPSKGALMKFCVNPRNVLMFVTDESDYMLAGGALLKRSLDAVEILQETSLSLTEMMDMANNVYSTLSDLENVSGMVAAEKFSNVLWGNPDYVELRAVNECLKDDRLSSDHQRYYSYAKITCMDVERSLASYNG
ncbi:hypothetical protein QE152_g1524 [Popillia japonica]|uniref:Uncharacterized protein n=1 Tax=Popillia japonica TaxID=7064 RepID=A0AAW1N6L3_POPJA